MSSVRWSEQELATLNRVYQIATWEGIDNALPGRTRYAIHRMAASRDIQRKIALKPHWTGAQKKLLGDMFPRAAWPELLSAFAPHTRFAIAKMAQGMGLRRPPREFKRKRRRPILNALRKRRIELGYSQAALAKRIGTHQKNLQTWEAGTSVPRLRKFWDWVDALECSLCLSG